MYLHMYRGRASKNLKYTTRNLDGMRFKNTSLPTSYPADTVQFIKSREAGESPGPNSSVLDSTEAESVIYGNLISEMQ